MISSKKKLVAGGLAAGAVCSATIAGQITPASASTSAHTSSQSPAMRPPPASPSPYVEYRKYFNPGARPIPASGTKWVPQGLANWGNDKLAISYYDGTYSDKDYLKRDFSRIVIVDRASLKEITYFKLNTKRHVGGLAYTRGYLWVATNSSLLRYSTAKLFGGRGSTIHADTKPIPVYSKASYAFGDGSSIWVGTCNETKRDYMYRYSVSGGKLGKYPTKIRTPSKVQGVAVVGSKIIWSTSWGNANSKLVVWPTKTVYNGSKAIGNWVTAPPRAEGMAYANGHLHLVYESGAKKYSKTPNIIRSIHHGTVPSFKG